MTLMQRIEAAMREAMKARDERRTQTLRMAIAAAQNRRIELRRDLADDDVVEIVAKQVKQRQESEELFRAGARPELAEREAAEAAILGEFLPEPVAADDLERLVRAAIVDVGAAGPADLGRVMGRVAPQVRGRADGRALSELVRTLLSERGSSG
ncbi:MAG: GatB/YqeY domain-containing protein [Chloroflexota bacterium]|nr:GatB/YqeY domain-containing protein [Chloroflexota bacterium]